MKYKTLWSALVLTALTIATQNSLAQSLLVDQGVAYISTSKFVRGKTAQLLEINYKTKSHKQLDSAPRAIDMIQLSPNRRFLAYQWQDRRNKKIKLMDLNTGKFLLDEDTDVEFIRWSADSRRLSYGNQYNVEIVEYDLSSRKKHIARNEGYTFLVEWQQKCNCFEYQISFRNTNHFSNLLMQSRVYHLVDNQLLPTEKMTLSSSPDDQFVFNFVGEYEADTELVFMKKEDMKGYLNTRAGYLNASKEVMWIGDNVARFFPEATRISLGDLVVQEHWKSRKKDIALDANGYVLIWDKSKKMLQLEDVAKGEFVQSFPAFWM